MQYFLNRPLILEQEIVKALKTYFKSLRAKDYYKNWSITVTNDHPFAVMVSKDFQYNASLFPVIVVSTQNDSKPTGFVNLVETQELILEKTDIPLLQKEGYMVCNELLQDLEKEFLNRNELYGVTHIIRRQEKISIEIWSENIQLKNELYELCRLFIAGGIHETMQKFRKNNNLVIFDNTITGDRSGNYNFDFGVNLAGSRLTFDADYYIEQSIIDSDIRTKNIQWEVTNSVKTSS